MKLDYTKPYLRTVTYKEINGKLERTYVLTAVKAKVKPKREKPSDKPVYVSSCKLNIYIPSANKVKKDENGKIIPHSFYGEFGKKIIDNYRKQKERHDAATLTFQSHVIPKMTAVEKAERMEKHKQESKMKRIIRSKQKKASYPVKPFEWKLFNHEFYAYLREERWIKSNKLEAIHESRIQAILERLKNTYLIQKVHATKIDTNTGVLKRKTVEKAQSINVTEKVAETAAKCTNPPTKHVFAINAKDKVPYIGKAVKSEMKSAA